MWAKAFRIAIPRFRPPNGGSIPRSSRSDGSIWSLGTARRLVSSACSPPLAPSKASSAITAGSRRTFCTTSQFRNAVKQAKTRIASKGGSPPTDKNLGLTARLRKLSREYGWAALGVYLGLSVLDFPFCFLLVRIVGTERIGKIEHFIVSYAKKAIPQSIKDWWCAYKEALQITEQDNLGDNQISEHVERIGWGVEEAEAANKKEASLGTQLALAYAIHKSFIFARVPLTAAVTPKVVKVLRSWGWDIGKRKGKPGQR